MSAWKYKRVIPKVIVAKLRLIDPKTIEDLVGKSLRDVCSMLAKTPYQEEISDIPAKQLNTVSLEKALQKNFLRTCEGILKHSPKDIRLLLSAILMKPATVSFT